MKFLVAVLCLVAVAVAESDLEKWQQFKANHGKLYSNHVEESQRYATFQSNLRKIEEHNAKYQSGEKSYYLGVNQFADMTSEEFKSMLARSYKKGGQIKADAIFVPQADASVPASFDWREKGAVTRVKDQAECGGCWSFSAIGVTESHYFIQNKKLLEFSEQQVIDCTQTSEYEQDGCNGGLEQVGLEYIKDSGIETEEAYPFVGYDSWSCQYNKSAVTAQLKSVVKVPSLNVAALKEAIATKGPTTVAIDAGSVQFYDGGIFNDDDCGSEEEELDHALVIVGYGSANGADYWLIKNSWGTTWGENGYVRFRSGSNLCGVELDNYYGTF